MDWWILVVCGLLGALIGNLAARWWGSLSRVRAQERVRRWWKSGLSSPPASIGVRRKDGTVEQMRPVRVSGLHIVVEPLRGKQRTWEMVSAGDAADTDEFWRTWKVLGGRGSGWIDEDGDDFNPGA
jgi:hypothetical protein